jgi:uncharacterized protein (TIGR03067 family)
VGILATTLLIVAQTDADKSAKEELARLKGEWRLVSSEANGRKASRDEMKKVTLRVVGTTLTVNQGDKSSDYAVTLRADKTPKQIDLVPGEGPDKDKTLPGIYLLDGDHLKLCLSKAGKGRPKEFTAESGSGRVLLVLKRVK